MKMTLLAGIAAASLLMSPMAIMAQDGDSPPEKQVAIEAAYVDLADSFTNPAMTEIAFDTAMRAGFEGVLRTDPGMATLDRECPGLINAMSDAARPIMWPAHQRDYAQFRLELIDLFSEELEPDIARGAADFYGSEPGQSLLRTLMSNYSASSTIASVLDDPDAKVSGHALEADMRATAAAGIQALSPEEFAAMNAQLKGAVWLPAMTRLGPQLNALQLKMANKDLSEEENTALDTALEGVFESHFATCEAAE